MSYQVIARKYRPQRFADVVGQEHVTQTLSNAIASGRIAHAYLFSGPRGTGKTTIARIFAKCLNATDGPSVDFKDDDERCVEITQGRALDVLEIDGASNNGVEQVRELRDTAPYAPATCRYKVYIIDEVHMLTTAAFNALLKTLEEPPAHVKFLFATTEPEKVLPTILSRCQRFDLRRIPAAKIVSHLELIAKQEGVTIEPPALQAIARGADGGMRDAESTLDQLISFCGETIQESDVLSMFGLTSQTQVLSLGEAVLRTDAAGALGQLHELTTGGKELSRLVGDLLDHFRNVMIYQVSEGDTGILEISEAEQTALAEQAQLADRSAVSRILEVLADCEIQLRNATSKKILVEVALMKAMDAARAMSLNDVLDRLQELRDAGGGEALEVARPVPAAVPVKKAKTEPKADPKSEQKTETVRQVAVEPIAETKPERAPEPTPQVNEEPTPQPVPATDLSTVWAVMLDTLGVFSRAYFQEAFLKSIEGDDVIIGFPEAFAPQMELANSKETNQSLIAALSKAGHSIRTVSYVIAERPSDWIPLAMDAPGASEAAVEPATNAGGEPLPPKGPINKEEFENDPLIKKALEVFKGQIVDVRN
ncbi:MAG: DNA polymerase III subunit gamma/tau [Limisphaerales bacterium]|nr:MAG: DNA polymerase III subunit gamma/tau [Limisphaerales bacterium]